MTVEMGDYAWSEHIVTVFLACQITTKNVQVQLTVKGKTTPDNYTPTPKSSCALRHRHARFDWSHDHLGWTIRTWRRVHWSDESHFLLRPTDGRARVWRQLNTSFQDNHIFCIG
jgi:hypothetical protein